jgi:hypothetical protein
MSLRTLSCSIPNLLCCQLGAREGMAVKGTESTETMKIDVGR